MFKRMLNSMVGSVTHATGKELIRHLGACNGWSADREGDSSVSFIVEAEGHTEGVMCVIRAGIVRFVSISGGQFSANAAWMKVLTAMMLNNDDLHYAKWSLNEKGNLRLFYTAALANLDAEQFGQIVREMVVQNSQMDQCLSQMGLI